jgi:hypothetical protein
MWLADGVAVGQSADRRHSDGRWCAAADMTATAVGQFEDLVEILADQQHRRAAVALFHDLAADFGDRGEVEPEAGLATISTSTSPDSSRARMARCTLPPDSVSIGVSGEAS